MLININCKEMKQATVRPIKNQFKPPAVYTNYETFYTTTY